MGVEIVFIFLFMAIFGIVYVFITAKHKENINLLKLIELDKDISSFRAKAVSNNQSKKPIWKIFILNISLLAMGIGFGTLIAAFLMTNFNLEDQVVYPPSIFMSIGIALFTGLILSKKMIPDN